MFEVIFSKDGKQVFRTEFALATPSDQDEFDGALLDAIQSFPRLSSLRIVRDNVSILIRQMRAESTHAD